MKFNKVFKKYLNEMATTIKDKEKLITDYGMTIGGHKTSDGDRYHIKYLDTGTTTGGFVSKEEAINNAYRQALKKKAKEPVKEAKMDHTEYPKRLRKKTDEELRFIIKDANEAMNANPDSEKSRNGYYADEVNYASMELKRREDEKKK